MTENQTHFTKSDYVILFHILEKTRLAEINAYLAVLIRQTPPAGWVGVSVVEAELVVRIVEDVVVLEVEDVVVGKASTNLI